MNPDCVALSKKLSYQLRHNLHNIPETSEEGYVPIKVLLPKLGRGATLDTVQHIVASNDKQRFHMIKKGNDFWIRANQGHSHASGSVIDPSKVLTKIHQPRKYCVHGTTHTAYLKIQAEGLKCMSRTHIHFASSPNSISGYRQSSEVLIHIDMEKAMNAGIEFWESQNGVILSNGMNGTIPPEYFKHVSL